MIHLKRVANEIKTVGLYDLILQDVQNIANKKKLSLDEIIEIIKTNPKILESYKQLNVEYNIGNIHLRDIDIAKCPDQHKPAAKTINKKLNKLRDIEKYTLDFEQSSVLVIIFSIEFFVLFSVQYFIVLLDLKEWQWLIYGVFASSVGIAWWYAKKEQKKFKKYKKEFLSEYQNTLKLIDELESKGAINKKDLIIKECED